jgi:glycerol-3-phosphate O-acyltransferase
LFHIVDTFFEGSLEEISFVPININYEKTIEAEAYARELLGVSHILLSIS